MTEDEFNNLKYFDYHIKINLPFFEDLDNLVIVGGDYGVGYAITTVEMYRNFVIGYGHIDEDGDLMRYHEKIGTYKDVDLLEEIAL